MMSDFVEGRYYCAFHGDLVLIMEYIGLDRFKCLYDSDSEWTNKILSFQIDTFGDPIIIDDETNILIGTDNINKEYDDYDKMIQDIIIDSL